MIKKIVIAATIGALAVAFAYREGYTNARTESAKEALENAVKMEDQYREQENKWSQRLAEIQEDRDRALSKSSDLRADLEQLRSEYANARNTMSQATSGSGYFAREQLRRSVDLNERCARLVERYDRVLSRASADKDALASIISSEQEVK